MTLVDIISPDHIIADLAADEHWPAIEAITRHLMETGSLSPEQTELALEALKSREEHCSTGIGGGVAIPHAFLPGLEKVVAIFARSLKGVDFSAQDRAPVHYIVLFLVPDGQHVLHLKSLAAIAKTLNSAQIRTQLASAPDADSLYAVLSRREQNT